MSAMMYKKNNLFFKISTCVIIFLVFLLAVRVYNQDHSEENISLGEIQAVHFDTRENQETKDLVKTTEKPQTTTTTKCTTITTRNPEVSTTTTCITTITTTSSTERPTTTTSRCTNTTVVTITTQGTEKPTTTVTCLTTTSPTQQTTIEPQITTIKPNTTEIVKELDTDETVLDKLTLDWLSLLLDCNNKDYSTIKRLRGDHWLIQNYIKAGHGHVGCHESITYTTHGDFTFLDNMVPLLKRWNAPVSMALYTPGTDLQDTVNSIRYLRDCDPDGDLVKQWTTFHVYFDNKHIPTEIPDVEKLLLEPFNCSVPVPYEANTTYRREQDIVYPINVGRNLAREAAMTYFVLPSDVELYPSPKLVPRFLNLVARNPPLMASFKTKPRVYPLSIFEVEEDQSVPDNKTQLVSMLKSKKAIPFHLRVCPKCHNVPKSHEWMEKPETNKMDIFHVAKRNGDYVHWEPIYIGTNDDPFYDERLSWDGKSDKMTQGYAFCVLDYDFMILNNAFLVHRPGIKVFHADSKRDRLVVETNRFIANKILPEMKLLFGTRPGCVV